MLNKVETKRIIKLKENIEDLMINLQSKFNQEELELFKERVEKESPTITLKESIDWFEKTTPRLQHYFNLKEIVGDLDSMFQIKEI